MQPSEIIKPSWIQQKNLENTGIGRIVVYLCLCEAPEEIGKVTCGDRGGGQLCVNLFLFLRNFLCALLTSFQLKKKKKYCL